MNKSCCGFILVHEEADFPKPASPRPPILHKYSWTLALQVVEYTGNGSSWRTPSPGWVDDKTVFSILGKCTTSSATLGRCVFVLGVKRENRLSVPKAAYGVCDTIADSLMELLREKNDGPDQCRAIEAAAVELSEGLHCRHTRAGADFCHTFGDAACSSARRQRLTVKHRQGTLYDPVFRCLHP